MSRNILGARIRERRRNLGITQAELARRIGISASYVNLIERNKRGIAGALLRRTARALDLSLDELDGATERRLLETLDEIALQPDIAALDVEAEHAGELIGRFPGWARALAALARSERDATAAARALADRLTHDPFLGQSVHDMLTRIAAMRSAAEILVDFPDIPVERRSRFHHIVHEESRALSDVGEALAAYFDRADQAARTLTPLDEVEALFDAHENHFAALEGAAEELAPRVDRGTPGAPQDAARTIAETHLGPVIDAIIAAEPQVETTPAQRRAREALLAYATDAVLLPMSGFEAVAQELRFDVDALAGAFSVSVQTVCHRLTALAPGPRTPRFGYLRANAAGAIIEMRRLPGLVAPRHAPACPLWVLYRAQQSPESMIRQRALFPSGARFIFLARAGHAGPPGFGRPRHYLTDMLAVSEEQAAWTVYAPDPAVPVEEVGPACRICPRRSCAHRVADPLAG